MIFKIKKTRIQVSIIFTEKLSWIALKTNIYINMHKCVCVDEREGERGGDRERKRDQAYVKRTFLLEIPTCNRHNSLRPSSLSATRI